MKPLGYFANLPTIIETTELTQPQLRELIARMMSLSSSKWHYENAACPPTFPTWVEQHWDCLQADPISVIQWAAQYLENEGGDS